MIQSRLCELHKKKINPLCLNLHCNNVGLACLDCVTSDALHIGHLKSLYEIETFEEILNYQNSDAPIQLINYVKQQIQQSKTIQRNENEKCRTSILISSNQINQTIKQAKKIKRRLKSYTEKDVSFMSIKMIIMEQSNYSFNHQFRIHSINYHYGILERLYDKWGNIMNLLNGTIKHWQLSLSMFFHQVVKVQILLRFNCVGQALRQMGQYRESIEWFDTAQAIEPKNQKKNILGTYHYFVKAKAYENCYQGQKQIQLENLKKHLMSLVKRYNWNLVRVGLKTK